MPQLLLGVDVGGSSVKSGVVDPSTGQLVGNTVSAPTPKDSTPQNVAAVIAQLAEQLPQATGPVGVTYPGVVQWGVVRSAANINHAWLGVNGAAVVGSTLGRPVVFLNDADAAGVAEMRWGAGRGHMGTAIMLTFGTGIGSAIFVGGKLFPNTEFGHMELDGKEAEAFCSARVRTVEGLDFPQWTARVNHFLGRMQALFWPDIFILGGAVSERFAEFAPLLNVEAGIRPAQFGNQAGIIGAALAAAEQTYGT